MPHPFGHPSSEPLLNRIIHLFKTGKFSQKKDRHIIFLCGGPVDSRPISLRKRLKNFLCAGPVNSRSTSLRKKFINYTDKNLSKFRILLAETVIKDISQHSEPQFYNIADFETFLADISDCLLIFPESPGSIAEIGFFSNNPITAKKVLAVTDLHRQHDSFIYIGPMDKIDRISIFKTVVIDYNNPDFDLIKTRLESRLPTIMGKSFNYKKFDDYSPQERLYIVYQLLIIFSALTLDGLKHCIFKMFGKYEIEEVKHLLSFLIASNYVKRVGNYEQYFAPQKPYESFLKLRRKGSIEDIRIEVLEYYQKHHKETYNIIKSL